MKTILCFGDSNTWGYNPVSCDRFPAESRWPGVLKATLGDGWTVIPEGLNGRTTVWEDPIEEYKNGKSYLYPCLESHKPLDLVVILLGTNDLKFRFHVGASDIADSAGRLAEIVRSSTAGPGGKAPRVLVLAPPPILETGPFVEMFKGGADKSANFRKEFERMGKQKNIDILFVEDVASSSPVDGIHLSAEGQAAIGRAVAAKAREMV